MQWIVKNAPSTNSSATISISYAGVVYATITSDPGAGEAVFLAANGATVQGTVPVYWYQDPQPNWENQSITLPNSVPRAGKIEITFTSTHSTDDDFLLSLFSIHSCRDLDGDGIPDYLDLDSDNDGCLDAVEGSDNVKDNMLVTAANTLSVGSGSSAENKNLCAGSNCVNEQGIPILVNVGGAADINNDLGQGIGKSADTLQNACICFETPTTGTGLPVKHGITSLQRAGTGSNWPMVRTGAHTALEAKTKGFVINRMASPETAIVNPVEGMLVFDTDANAGEGCLKLYDGTSWDCLSNPTCPE